VPANSASRNQQVVRKVGVAATAVAGSRCLEIDTKFGLFRSIAYSPDVVLSNSLNGTILVESIANVRVVLLVKGFTFNEAFS
jgi:hypothetical protein